MKKSIQNIILGLEVMKTYRKHGHNTRRFLSALCFTAAMLAFVGAEAVYAGIYDVRNESELLTVLDHIENNDPGYTDLSNTIVLLDNVLVENPQTFTIDAGKTLTIDLSRYNLQGNGILNIVGAGSLPADSVINIIGSTMAFNDGIRLQGKLTLNYTGMYTANTTDLIGENAGDDIIVNVTDIGSGWDAFNHDVVIGEAGTATFKINNGNWGKSENLRVANLGGSFGAMDISGQGTIWNNSDNTEVGISGNGELNLHGGAVLNTGNFGIGLNAGGSGKVNVSGNGTILNIIGTNNGAAIPTAGDATLHVFERGQVYLSYNDLLSGDAYLSLGDGRSEFDDAYFQIDRGFIDGVSNGFSFMTNSMFEGTTYDYDAGANYSTIDVESMEFTTGAVFSPGYGNYSLWQQGGNVDLSIPGQIALYYLGKNAGDDRFGYLDITVNSADGFDLTTDSLSIFDFDVQGNNNHVNYAVDGLEHKDYVNVTGDAKLNGTVHFRPMTGYYTDDIDVEFLNGTSVTGTPTLSMWPNRWFENAEIDLSSGDSANLTMTRHTSPFTTAARSYNEGTVGAALDWIYNAHQAAQVDNDIDVQRQDDWFPVLDWFWPMDDDQFREAMRQLAGETRAVSFYMPIRSPWRFGFDRVNWRKRDNHVYFGQQNVNSPYVAKQDLWVTPYYDYMHLGTDNNTSKANISRVSFMAGYDRALSKHSAFGVLFGYSQPKLDQVYTRVIADDYLIGLHYHRLTSYGVEMKLWGGYGTQNYRLTRSVPIGNGEHLSAKLSGNSWTGSIQGAIPYSVKHGIIRPFAAMDVSYIEQGNATETGYMPIALHYNSADWLQVHSRVGLKGDFAWSRLNFSGSVSYSYLVAGDDAPAATHQFVVDGPRFEIQGHDLSRSTVNVGLGTQVYLNRLKSRMFFVQYNGAYSEHSNSQNASIGYQMTF